MCETCEIFFLLIHIFLVLGYKLSFVFKASKTFSDTKSFGASQRNSHWKRFYFPEDNYSYLQPFLRFTGLLA